MTKVLKNFVNKTIEDIRTGNTTYELAMKNLYNFSCKHKVSEGDIASTSFIFCEEYHSTIYPDAVDSIIKKIDNSFLNLNRSDFFFFIEEILCKSQICIGHFNFLVDAKEAFED